VRFLGTFLEDSIAVLSEVVQTLSRQLGITKSEAIGEYRQGRWRRQHAAEIRARFGYRDFSDLAAGPCLIPPYPMGSCGPRYSPRSLAPNSPQTLEAVETLVRPPDDVYYQELAARYRGVRHFLPAVLKHLRFETNPAGELVVEAFKWLGVNEPLTKPANDASRGRRWREHFPTPPSPPRFATPSRAADLFPLFCSWLSFH
jgi:Domain of unknown function (DUF4158)